MANGIPWKMQVVLQRRRAVAQLTPRQAKDYGLGSEAGDYGCFVLATLQETDSHIGTIPVFVCEFINGCVGNIYTERVSFIDTDDKGEIIE